MVPAVAICFSSGESTAPPPAPLVALPATSQCDGFHVGLCTPKVPGVLDRNMDHAQQAKEPFANSRLEIARTWRRAVEHMEQCRRYFRLLGFRFPGFHSTFIHLTHQVDLSPVSSSNPGRALLSLPLLLDCSFRLLASAGSASSHLPFDFSPLPCQACPRGPPP